MVQRIKSKTQIEPVADWQAADKLVRQIGNLQLQINNHEAIAKETIDAAKTKLAQDVNPLQDKIAILTNSLEAFAINNKKDFSRSQSRKLNFGKIGWRKSSEISIKKTTLDLIKKVFGKKAAQYIHVKETVNKETLKALTDERLVSLDARRKNKEPFFVEPDLPQAVDYGTQ